MKQAWGHTWVWTLVLGVGMTSADRGYWTDAGQNLLEDKNEAKDRIKMDARFILLEANATHSLIAFES